MSPVGMIGSYPHQYEVILIQVSSCLLWNRCCSREPGIAANRPIAAQVAGRYLKQIIEEGYDSQREMYTMTEEEVLQHLDAVVEEVKQRGTMPMIPLGLEEVTPAGLDCGR